MGFNIKYLKSIVCILKIASLILGILACSIGVDAYLNSKYNKTCREGTSATEKTLPSTPTTTPSSTLPTVPGNTTATTLPTTTPTTTTVPTLPTSISNGSSSQTTPTDDSISSSTATEIPEPGDRLPILWMEKFHLLASGLCTLFGIIFLIAVLVKGDLLENKYVRGVDFGFHFVGIIWLMIGAIFMAFSATQIEEISDELCSEDVEKCQLFKEKMSSAGLSFVQAVCFAGICARGYGQKMYQRFDA